MGLVLFILVYAFLVALIVLDIPIYGTLIIIMSFFSGFRGSVGIDTCEYRIYFKNFDFVTYENIEPLFNFFTYLLKLITDSTQFFIFCIALLQGFFLYFITKRVASKKYFMLVFLLVFYYPFFFNIIRNGLSVLIFGCGYIMYLQGRRILPFMASIFSGLVHFSAVPFQIAIVRNKILYLIVLSLLIFAFMQTQYVDQLYIHYVKAEDIINPDLMLDRDVRFHVYISIMILLFVILFSFYDVKTIILYLLFLLIPSILGLYFYKLSRLTLLPLFCLLIFHSVNYNSYGTKRRALINFYYFYLFLSFTIYPLLYGDERVVNAYAEVVNSSSSNYVFWFLDDTKLCNIW